MKKFLAILLALVMVLGVFAGCSQNTDDKTKETNAAQQDSVQENTGDGEKQILNMMAVGTTGNEAYMAVMTDAINEFNKNNTYNVEIQIEWYENEAYTAKLTTLMTQNEQPDIFFTWAAGYLEPYVEAGRVLSLAPYMEEDAEWASRFYDGTLTSTTFNGEVYAVPASMNVGVMYYSKTIFEQCGLEIPETWEDFENVCTVLNKNGYIPMALGGSAPWVVSYLVGMIQGGISGTDAFNGLFDGSSKWADVYTETFEVYQHLVDIGAFSEYCLGVGYDESREEFVSGSAAMYPMGNWDTAAVLEGFNYDESTVGAFFLPSYNADMQTCSVGQTDMNFAVSSECVVPEAAVEFIKMLSTPAYQGRFVLETGGLPVADADTSAGEIDGITQMIIDEMKTATSIQPADAFGEPLTSEIFNVCVAVASGENAAEQAAYLQEFADSQG